VLLSILNNKKKDVFWLAGGRLLWAWGIVLLVFLLLLIPVGGPITDPWAACCWDLLHLPAFYALTRSLRMLSGGVTDGWREIVLATLLAMLCAAGSELIQSVIGRSASVHDLTLDAFGISLGLLAPMGTSGAGNLRPAASGLIFVGGVLFAFGPALGTEAAKHRARERLPDIGGFEDPNSPRLWRPQGACATRRDPATGALHVKWLRGDFGGLQFLPGEQDWSPYTELRLVVFNPGPAVVLGIRIDDPLSAKDRVWHSSEATVGEGASEILVPLRKRPAPSGIREVDFSRTRRLVLFLESVEKPVEFSIISAGLR
jgi:hypothetical protein